MAAHSAAVFFSFTPLSSRLRFHGEMKHATTIIKKDHRAVEAAYESYMSAKTDAKKLSFAKEILTALTAHAKMEEKHFYPALRKEGKARGKALVLEAAVEHGEVKMIIAFLKKLKPGRALDAGLSMLLGLVGHHVKEEEREILPYAEEVLGAERMEELGEKMEPFSGVNNT